MRSRIEFLVIVCLNAFTFEASARGTIQLNSCIVTWGRFCPIETIGGTIAAVAVFVLVGITFRIYGEREYRVGRIAEYKVRMKRGIFLMKWSTYLGLATLVLAIAGLAVLIAVA